MGETERHLVRLSTERSTNLMIALYEHSQGNGYLHLNIAELIHRLHPELRISQDNDQITTAIAKEYGKRVKEQTHGQKRKVNLELRQTQENVSTLTRIANIFEDDSTGEIGTLLYGTISGVIERDHYYISVSRA